MKIKLFSLLQKCVLLLCLLCTLHPPLALADPYRGPLLARGQASAIDAAVLSQMKQQRVVGAAVGVIQRGQIVYLQGYGWADEQKQLPVDAHTMFRWASISKTLTAVSAFQLAERGDLDFRNDVRDYVPEFPDKGVTITSRNLLCHQSGIPHYSNGTIIKTKRVYDTPHPFEDVVTALDTFKESPLLFSPGEKFSYSTYAYMLLSAVVQKAGKQPFAAQVKERIATPLGMTTLQPDYQWLPIPNRAQGYALKQNEVVRDPHSDVSWKLGGGGFISNVEDLALYAQGLMQHRLLEASTYDVMWQPQTTKDGTLTEWSLGFQVRIEANNRLKVSHDGRQEGAKCRMVIYPGQQSAVVVMTNCDYGDPGRISTAIYSALSASATAR